MGRSGLTVISRNKRGYACNVVFPEQLDILIHIIHITNKLFSHGPTSLEKNSVYVHLKSITQFNPLPADVANKWRLGSAPMSPFVDLWQGKLKWLSCLTWWLFYWPGVYAIIANRRKEHSMFSKTRVKNWLNIDSVDPSFNWLIVETSHKAQERLALRETSRFHSWWWTS
jgi:hypothetical protein